MKMFNNNYPHRNMQRSELSSNTECLSELKRVRVYESYRTSIILEDLKLLRKIVGAREDALKPLEIL